MNQKKHAYLIIAHEEFEVLQKLVEALDDKRNDIFIHMDKKVRNLPVLRCKKAGLSWVENRVDVCWGHVSQIESEYVLFEAAKESGALYAYYHLISGTHMPLKSQEAIHAYFNRLQGKQVLNFLDATPYEVNFKMNRFHFFIKNHRHAHSLKAGMAQLFWRVLLRIQTLLRIKKKSPQAKRKANNWVSLTPSAVEYILQEKNKTLKEFRYSFCGDEFFVPYLLGKKAHAFQILDEKNLLFNEFEGSTPRVLTQQDFSFLMDSDYLFARKFNAEHLGVVERILEAVTLSPLEVKK